MELAGVRPPRELHLCVLLDTAQTMPTQLGVFDPMERKHGGSGQIHTAFRTIPRHPPTRPEA
eukprot:1134384-Karenia_brevis.AAC.1